jgi:hypothetical protein
VVKLGYKSQEEVDHNLCSSAQSNVRPCQVSTTVWQEDDAAGSIANPCFFYRHDTSAQLTTIEACFVNDAVVTGTKSDVDQFRNDLLKRHFTLSELGPITKHLSVWYQRGSDEQGE